MWGTSYVYQQLSTTTSTTTTRTTILYINNNSPTLETLCPQGRLFEKLPDANSSMHHIIRSGICWLHQCTHWFINASINLSTHSSTHPPVRHPSIHPITRVSARRMVGERQIQMLSRLSPGEEIEVLEREIASSNLQQHIFACGMTLRHDNVKRLEIWAKIRQA